MTDTPDFEALRAERNKRRQEFYDSMAKDGWKPATFCSLQDDNACYCDCARGGPCEHKWDGKPYESEDGCAYSSTCSRCGMTAISHDLRNAP